VRTPQQPKSPARPAPALRHLKAETLAQRLRELTTNDSYRTRAKAGATGIAQGNGIARAVKVATDAGEAWLTTK
jgi:UDP:flavonoid glycosyltransferase YjiC (YdhE family)